MATKIAYLEAVVGADITQFRRGMSEIRNETGLFAENATQQFGKVGQALNTLGRTLTYTITAPLAVFGASSAQAAMAFERNMNNVNSIAKMSQGQLDALSDKFLEIGSSSIFGAEQTSAAGYEIFSAGVTDSAMAAEILATSVKVAEANLSDLGATTKAINATIAAFDLTQEDATRVGNVWTRMVQLGVGSMDDFLSNAQKILPLAKEVGLSFEELGATVAFASQGGGGAAKAETAVAQTISNLLRPNLTMMKGFTELGVKNAKELLQKFGGLAPALMELKRVGKDAFPKMFAKSGLEAVLRLTANIDKTTASMTEFNRGLDTATQSAWEEQAKGSEFQLRRLGAAFEGVRVIIGQAILPAITPFVEGLRNIMETIMNLNPEVVQFGVIFMGAVAALPPLIWAVGSAMSLILSPIGLVVGAVGGLAIAFATNLGGVRDILDNIVGGFDWVTKAANDFMAGFSPRGSEGQYKEAGELIGTEFATGIQVSVETATSAWEVYSKDFAETMNWADFQKTLRDQGWGGGAILPEDSFTFGGTGETYNDFGEQDFLDPTKNMGKTEIGFFDRIANGIEAAWPTIQTALDNMWANIKTWFTDTFLPTFDTWGGDILGAISGAFSTETSDGSGGGTLYQAIKGIFTGDLSQASGEFGSWLQETFPEIGNGLGGLFESIGNWILTEGVPSAARIGGFLAGTLLGGIINGINLVFTALGSLLSSGGDTSAVGGYIEESIFTPMQAGFTEGFEGTGAGAVVESFGASIIAAIQTGLSNLEGLGEAVAGFGSAVVEEIKNYFTGEDAVTRISGALSALFITAAAAVAAPSIITALSGVIGGAVQAVTFGMWAVKYYALTSFLPALGTMATGAVTAMAPMALAVAPLLLLAGGIAGIIALLSNEDIRKGLETWGDIFKNTFTLLSEFITTLWSDIKMLLANIVLEFLKLELTALTILSIVDGSKKDEVNTVGLQIQGMETAKLAYEDLRTNGDLTEVGGGGLTWALGAMYEDKDAKVFVQSMLDTLPDKSLIERQLNDALINDEFSNIEVLMPLQMAAMTQGMDEEEAKTVVTEWIQGLIAGGTFDGQGLEILKSYLSGAIPTALTPTEEGATTPFDAGIDLATVTVDTQAIGNNLQIMSDNANAFSNTVDMTKPALDSTQVTVAGVVVQTNKWADATSRVLDNLRDIDNLGGTPPPEPDGTHATGLDRVPFNGYMAELHRGERVLTAAEADRLDAKNIVGYNRGQQTKSEYNTNNISITGVQDVDGLLSELRRRGIYVS